jgi:cytidylate kinase
MKEVLMNYQLTPDRIARIHQARPKIAISGKSGCGNTTVSGMVAEALGFRLINYTFRNLAEDKGMTFRELHSLAQHDSSWDRYLDTRQVELAQDGNCVLGSRLAIWVLKDADLRVFLTASPEVRARRILRREGGNLTKVKEETRHRDAKDRQRYLSIYGIDNDNYQFADLVINTDNILPDQITKMILDRLEQKLDIDPDSASD